MKSAEIRRAFLEYFRGKGHELVKSSSLIPADDPTLLFTNAGMVQFKRVFQGDESRPYKRAATCQKCMRAGGKHSDIENVGYTRRHHTFFEMLGNFSFGDYFKREAIGYAWELLTGVFKLPPEKLWVSVYEEDDEAEKLWQEVAGVPKERIVRLGAKDNFWQMADTGPCGPCSEIIIDQGEELSCGPDCKIGCDCDRYLELWNLVFMQFNRDEKGVLHPLPRPSIDTGMGLERIAAVLQGKKNNFDTDLFAGIIQSIETNTGARYGKDEEQDIPIRVIADHLRSITFLLSEGLMPSNEGRGYVLRRVIRRAARYARNLGAHGPVLYKMADSVAYEMGEVYPELHREKERMKKLLFMEEERFANTLEQGMRLLEEMIAALKKEGKKELPGEGIFRLYDTFGFPLDIVRDVAAEEGLSVDERGFERQMQFQKERARASWVQEDQAAESIYRELRSELGGTIFTGYEALQTDSLVKGIIKEGRIVNELGPGREGEIILDKTPFYGESGGQVGDTGKMYTDSLLLEVLNTKKPLEDLIIHEVKVEKGRLRVWDRVTAAVNEEKRRATMRNHTATHLLHAALKSVVGEHVKQAGSLVEPQRLRFDFTHFSSLTPEELEEIEDFVNRNVLDNIPVHTEEMEIDQAIAEGATALFGEKYGERVRVVQARDISKELCGGTHVKSTGEIGAFIILYEGSVASGIRRIEALTGMNALIHLREKRKELRDISQTLKTEKPVERAAELLEKIKSLEKELEKIKSAGAQDTAKELIGRARELDGVKVVSEKVSGFSQKELRELADGIRDRLGSGVIVLASEEGALLAMVTKDLTKKLKAGEILGQVAAIAGGRGGGKPELAQGGTKETDKLDSAIQKVYDIVEKGLKK
jgi:alanyl-tRNA synthetase